RHRRGTPLAQPTRRRGAGGAPVQQQCQQVDSYRVRRAKPAEGALNQLGPVEDAGASSILKKVRGKATKEWAPRFDHGCSQLIDWFYALDDMRKTSAFTKHFGHGHIKFFGLLLIGRSDGLSEDDRIRLKWRTEKVVVDSHP